MCFCWQNQTWNLKKCDDIFLFVLFIFPSHVFFLLSTNSHVRIVTNHLFCFLFFVFNYIWWNCVIFSGETFLSASLSVHKLFRSIVAPCLFPIWNRKSWSKALCEECTKTDGSRGMFFMPLYLMHMYMFILLALLVSFFVGWFVPVRGWTARKANLSLFLKW